jgi:hypothetical protein
MNTHTGPDRFQPLAEVASLLARGYLRLLETSRQSAVSSRRAAQIPLEGGREPRPDGHVLRDVRRAE